MTLFVILAVGYLLYRIRKLEARVVELEKLKGPVTLLAREYINEGRRRS